ncbi:hypothetical protein HHA01_25740 [Halomonas halmophila]|uniref:Uncharacterized protein n=1 Tax=Halomonas halmophila TaxID=252 RepID=A0A4Y4F296_9GAMM|nr:hypothetical protein HHA01_25740 [Halomonas halmophila]
MAETVIDLIKTDVHRRSEPWRYLEAVELATNRLVPPSAAPGADRQHAAGPLYDEQQRQAKKEA